MVNQLITNLTNLLYIIMVNNVYQNTISSVCLKKKVFMHILRTVGSK